MTDEKTSEQLFLEKNEDSVFEMNADNLKLNQKLEVERMKEELKIYKEQKKN